MVNALHLMTGALADGTDAAEKAALGRGRIVVIGPDRESAGDAPRVALLHAQEAAKRVCYDYHQFLGGMGMTLEHPLHLWTYRLKLLTAELGGRGAQGLAAAEALWG